MYPSPFCNLPWRRWIGGGVQVGCGAGGAPTGRLMVPAAGCAGWRPVPTEPPPDTETPRQIPGHFAPDPCPRAGAGWRPVPTEPPSDTETPRRTRKPPASLPGTLGDGPTGQTPPGNPPPDSGALCVRPLPSGRRRAAPGGDRRRRSSRRTRKPPASLPGTLGDGPTGQTLSGNPPPDSGALCVRQRLHGIPRGLEGEELRGVGVVLSQLHEQDSRCAGWRGERALSSPSDRGIRDRGDCQVRCRSSQPKIRFRTSGRS